MPYEHILYEVENGRARVTLNRPQQRNALCPPLLDELERALWDADDDKRVHCVILRGAGPAFCAGYDLSGEGRAPLDDGVPRRGMRTIDDDIWSLERSNRRIRALWEMHKPSIAQVHGHCLAGGTDLALACDMLIAADDASIGFPPARNLGALPTVPPDLLEGEVEGLADRMALIDPDLLSANKRIVNLAMELMGAQVLQRLAAENDARGHLAPATKEYFRAVKEKGLAGAFRERDAKFGDRRALASGPELRDERGFLIEPEK